MSSLLEIKSLKPKLMTLLPNQVLGALYIDVDILVTRNLAAFFCSSLSAPSLFFFSVVVHYYKRPREEASSSLAAFLLLPPFSLILFIFCRLRILQGLYEQLHRSLIFWGHRIH
jgi:hypothetical protein